MTGWETMEVLAGSVAQSDAVFSEFTEVLDTVMGDKEAPGTVRHKVLQLALMYMSRISQLSTGAYFLRRDFFPSLVSLVKTQETEEYTFEAMLFLSILANYHKSDAAKLNPYLKRIRETMDGDFMRKLCWASNFALESSIKAYQDVSNDSPSPTLASSLGSVITRLRPDRAVSFASMGQPRDEYKDLPVEASVVLLPIYEFLRSNPLFVSVLLGDLVSPPTPGDNPVTPLPCTLITFASYLCAHASSTSSPRSKGYASLSLNILLALVENSIFMEFFTQTMAPSIRLCRQRLPIPPPSPPAQAPICAILDCCVLWLRHNLHKRLEVTSYINSIWICYRIVWFLHHRRIRLAYDWTDLWNSTIGLLGFLSSKQVVLNTAGDVQLLGLETIRFLDFALCTSETYLPSPRAVHEFIYELVRSSAVLKKQEELLKSLDAPHNRSSVDLTLEYLAHILIVTDFYEKKVSELDAGVGNAKDLMKIMADNIEANGIHGTRDMRETTPPTRSQDVLDFGRFACADVLALMP